MAVVLTLVLLLFLLLIVAGPVLESILDRFWPAGRRPHGPARR
ncbi:hypothetical protein Aph02nite_06190 [Actinoplanes philippinensis]|uniref:Uncharacterized protein n=1 Tax=Actinoplanes philippinensis TaxID=35752 RepID=A0A1I2CUH2_9ACTN|nr:hypothetical protein [Actinoplanes philippinensis]GIE74669.1 hypothetical protein Aph02nite_06190 [Actinoplanes philippinensis]SFE71987.1 hypothetical protein SAMN05421541_103213 [Actinoplanes philippinensis]